MITSDHFILRKIVFFSLGMTIISSLQWHFQSYCFARSPIATWFVDIIWYTCQKKRKNSLTVRWSYGLRFTPTYVFNHLTLRGGIPNSTFLQHHVFHVIFFKENPISDLVLEVLYQFFCTKLDNIWWKQILKNVAKFWGLRIIFLFKSFCFLFFS